MNIFYTFAVYFKILEKWSLHFRRSSVLDFPVPPDQIAAGKYWRLVINAAVELDMLDFLGCLDAPV